MYGNSADYKDIDLHLGISECQIYHSALIGFQSQTEIDRLHQLHILDRSEDDQDYHGNVPRCLSIVKKQV
jgi:hypothetical protein